MPPIWCNVLIVESKPQFKVWQPGRISALFFLLECFIVSDIIPMDTGLGDKYESLLLACTQNCPSPLSTKPLI